MDSMDFFETVKTETDDFINHPNIIKSLVLLLIAIIVAYWVSKFVAFLIIRVAQWVAVSSDAANSSERQVKLRRVETYLSVAIAMVRVVIVGVVGYYVWRLLSPPNDSTNSTAIAAISASTIFIVLAGGTIGMILKDITAGASMIIEQWFSVGDYVDIEPFDNLAGVVERVTLRSTKIRSLNGEVVWLHNQYIQGVRVTPRGLRTVAVDIFVNNKNVGRNLIEKAIATVPLGTIKVTKRPEITLLEQWGEKLFLITVVGEMPPGREWLMEKYFIESLHELDERRSGPKTMVRPPIARFADAAAERSFKRAVLLGKQSDDDDSDNISFAK